MGIIKSVGDGSKAEFLPEQKRKEFFIGKSVREWVAKWRLEDVARSRVGDWGEVPRLRTS